MRPERYVARWTALENAYQYGDWKDRTRAKAEMKALTSELKRDAPAEAVMKSPPRELGIEAGSRLAPLWPFLSKPLKSKDFSA